MYLYALSFVRNEEEVRDIINDVFEYAWNNFKKLDSSTSLCPLLYTLIRRRCIDYLRHEQTKERYRVYCVKCESELVEEYKDREVVIQRILERIDHMPVKTAEVFRKCFLEGKKYQETADELKISINTVRTHITKALRILRNQLSEQDFLLMIILLNK